MSSKFRIIAILLAIGFPVSRGVLAEEPLDYLKQIKPILAERCFACHGALKQEASLRLDTAKLAIQGGESGPAIKPGDAAASLLLERVSASDAAERMPPEGEALTPAQIELLKSWIAQNAAAPADESPEADPRSHWAYQPPNRPAVPAVRDPAWSSNPIDAFLASQYESAGVTPLEPADKATLLRRIYFDLIGLPPTREQLNTFAADNSPEAYEQLVMQLLASPQHGERWARHWMDVWRYSDWSGYGEEVRNSARHIWHWRDWIVEALNADKGYDRMVIEMLAGDEVAPDDPKTVRATGYLARNWDLYLRNAWLDNTVEHTAKAFLGVTMNCCRCHDHKYDPIGQKDYFRMRAVFEPYHVRTDRIPGERDILKNGLPRAYDATPDYPTYVAKRGDPAQPDTSQAMSPGVPEALGGKLAIEPVKLSRSAYYPGLRDSAVAEDEAAAAKLVVDRETARTTAQAAVVTAQKKVADLTAKMADASAAQSELSAAIDKAEIADRQWATARAAKASLRARVAAERAKYGSTADAAALALAAGKAECEFNLCTAHEQQVASMQELARAQAAKKADDPAKQAAVTAAEGKVAAAKTAVAAAHAALAAPSSSYKPLGEVATATSTGRRLALAQWIVDRNNPLAARVAVNHMWLRHFGAPLVDNTFDFGLRTTQARNQPLLDWLAVELMEHGWSMKHIHRLMVTSRVYRMKTSGSEQTTANAVIDPDNRLLWRMNPRRLEAEAIRDATLFVADKLDLTLGGPDIDQQLALESPRRSLYLRHAYEKQAKFLELFDGASVNECYRRGESVVPQQALALENGVLGLEQSRRLAAKLSTATDGEAVPDDVFLTQSFEQTLGRAPSSGEIVECLAFLKSQADTLRSKATLTPFKGGGKVAVEASDDPARRARESLVHVLLNHNDFVTIR